MTLGSLASRKPKESFVLFFFSREEGYPILWKIGNGGLRRGEVDPRLLFLRECE